MEERSFIEVFMMQRERREDHRGTGEGKKKKRDLPSREGICKKKKS